MRAEPKDPRVDVSWWLAVSSGTPTSNESEAPKAPLPKVDVPTPRWTTKELAFRPRSGVFTQKTPCDSGSFRATLLTVTLMRVWSIPRNRK